MGQGWKVDVDGASAIIREAARVGTTMQHAAADVDMALGGLVTVTAGTDAAGAAQGFIAARQGDASTAVRAVEQAITAATGAMNAFTEADATMADRTTAARSHAPGRAAR